MRNSDKTSHGTSSYIPEKHDNTIYLNVNDLKLKLNQKYTGNSEYKGQFPLSAHYNENLATQYVICKNQKRNLFVKKRNTIFMD